MQAADAPSPCAARGPLRRPRDAEARRTVVTTGALIALAAALTMLTVLVERGATPLAWRMLASATMAWLALAVCLAPAALLADAAVDRGRRPAPAYGAAALAAAACAALLQSLGHHALGWPTPFELAGHSRVTWAQPAGVFSGLAVWSLAIVALHAVWRAERLGAARLAAARLRRVRRQRELLDQQLRAARARIDPQRLLAALDDIDRACAHDAAQARRLLDGLADALRAALAQSQSQPQPQPQPQPRAQPVTETSAARAAAPPTWARGASPRPRTAR